MTALLDVEQLGEHLDRFRHRLFRLESLPAYSVESDGDDFRRWLAGDLSLSDHQRQWMDVLRRERAEGRITARVRVLSQELTDYELYSCHIYAHNAEAGEDIRVMRRGEHPQADLEPAVGRGDFWLIDDDEAVDMHYDEDGRYVGATVVPSAEVLPLRGIVDHAWKAAEPFGEWWARHPELHRRVD